MKPDLPLVFVKWLDAMSESSEWHDMAEFSPTLATCMSVGWLFKYTDDSVTLVASLNDSDCGCDVTIPRRVISEIRYLVGGAEYMFPSEFLVK